MNEPCGASHPHPQHHWINVDSNGYWCEGVAEPIDLAAVKAEHAGHGRMNGKGACSWVRRGEEHCDAYLLAVETERFTEAWFDGEAGRLDWAARALNAERERDEQIQEHVLWRTKALRYKRERDEARAEAERLAGKVARAQHLGRAWIANGTRRPDLNQARLTSVGYILLERLDREDAPTDLADQWPSSAGRSSRAGVPESTGDAS